MHNFYDRLKLFVVGLGITFCILLFIYIGTRPASPAEKTPIRTWKLISASMIPQEGKEIEATLGQAHEVEIEGCHYLIWIAPDNRSGNMLHKGNCPNHGIKLPEEPKEDAHPHKEQI